MKHNQSSVTPDLTHGVILLCCEIVSMGDPKNILFTTQLRFTALRSVIMDGYTVVTKVLHCNEFRCTCRVSNRSKQRMRTAKKRRRLAKYCEQALY